MPWKCTSCSLEIHDASFEPLFFHLTKYFRYYFQWVFLPTLVSKISSISSFLEYCTLSHSSNIITSVEYWKTYKSRHVFVELCLFPWFSSNSCAPSPLYFCERISQSSFEAVEENIWVPFYREVVDGVRHTHWIEINILNIF